MGIGRDHTLFAKTAGTVVFEIKGPKNSRYVRIEEAAPAA
jgi:large subunit ribosomal protein L27